MRKSIFSCQYFGSGCLITFSDPAWPSVTHSFPRVTTTLCWYLSTWKIVNKSQDLSGCGRQFQLLNWNLKYVCKKSNKAEYFIHWDPNSLWTSSRFCWLYIVCIDAISAYCPSTLRRGLQVVRSQIQNRHFGMYLMNSLTHQ